MITRLPALDDVNPEDYQEAINLGRELAKRNKERYAKEDREFKIGLIILGCVCSVGMFVVFVLPFLNM